MGKAEKKKAAERKGETRAGDEYLISTGTKGLAKTVEGIGRWHKHHSKRGGREGVGGACEDGG